MNFFSFATRSVLLSFAVALFWLPVLAVTFYAIYLLVVMMRDELIGLIMIVSMLYYPLQMLLLVLAVRAGMTILKVTTGSDIAKLGAVTAKVLFFNGLISVIIINLFGLAVLVTGLEILKPGYIDEFWNIARGGGIARDYLLDQHYSEFPLMLALGPTFGLCVAVALFAVNLAGQAAMAVDNPPMHHQLWGVGAQFLNIFLLGIVFIFVPNFVAIYLVGGLSTTIGDMNASQAEWADSGFFSIWIGAGLYNIWTICLLAAAAAQGYKLHLVDDETRRTRDIAEMAGLATSDAPKVDLSALRKARMGGVVAVDPYALGDDADEDEE